MDVAVAGRPDCATSVEQTVRAFSFAVERGWAFYWGTARWQPSAVFVCFSDRRLCSPVWSDPHHCLRLEATELFTNMHTICTAYSVCAGGARDRATPEPRAASARTQRVQYAAPREARRLRRRQQLQSSQCAHSRAHQTDSESESLTTNNSRRTVRRTRRGGVLAARVRHPFRKVRRRPAGRLARHSARLRVDGARASARIRRALVSRRRDRRRVRLSGPLASCGRREFGGGAERRRREWSRFVVVDRRGIALHCGAGRARGADGQRAGGRAGRREGARVGVVSAREAAPSGRHRRAPLVFARAARHRYRTAPYRIVLHRVKW